MSTVSSAVLYLISWRESLQHCWHSCVRQRNMLDGFNVDFYFFNIFPHRPDSGLNRSRS